MQTSPAQLVVDGLRADVTALATALAAADDGPDRRAQLCAAAAKLAELAVTHVSGADLQDVAVAADAVGDAVALLASAGLTRDDRGAARNALTERLRSLAAALPPTGGWRAPGTSRPHPICPDPPRRGAR